VRPRYMRRWLPLGNNALVQDEDEDEPALPGSTNLDPERRQAADTQPIPWPPPPPTMAIGNARLEDCASKQVMKSIFGGRGIIEQLRSVATWRAAHSSLPLSIAPLVLPKQHKTISVFSHHIMSTHSEPTLPKFINTTPGIYDHEQVDVFGMAISVQKLVREGSMKYLCTALVERIHGIEFLSQDEVAKHTSAHEQAGHTQKMFENAVQSNVKLAECMRFFDVSTALMTKAKADFDHDLLDTFRMHLKSQLFDMMNRFQPVKVPPGCESLYSSIGGHEETVSSVLINQLRLHLRLMDWMLWCLEYISGPIGESEAGSNSSGFLVGGKDKYPFFNVETFGRVIIRQLIYLSIQLPQRFQFHAHARNNDKIDLEVLSLWLRIWSPPPIPPILVFNPPPHTHPPTHNKQNITAYLYCWCCFFPPFFLKM
jgi:hypothetical protein